MTASSFEDCCRCPDHQHVRKGLPTSPQQLGLWDQCGGTYKLGSIGQSYSPNHAKTVFLLPTQTGTMNGSSRKTTPSAVVFPTVFPTHLGAPGHLKSQAYGSRIDRTQSLQAWALNSIPSTKQSHEHLKSQHPWPSLCLLDSETIKCVKQHFLEWLNVMVGWEE